MSCPHCAPGTVPAVLAGICSTGIRAYFTGEKIEAHRGHTWPGQGGIAWTGLPQTPLSPFRPQGHLFGDPMNFMLPGSPYCHLPSQRVFTPWFVSSLAGTGSL